VIRLREILEVALYHDAADGRAMTSFYEGVLGLREVASWPGGRALRLGGAVVLLFEREGLAEREGPIADHGASGPGHVCLTVGPEDYEDGKASIAGHTEIIHEHEWEDGRRSFYFRDPAGNLLEIADGDLWPD
jgi:catechol 2,3-dioxygenase-like lactoylglutathione lyase family enzyme